MNKDCKGFSSHAWEASTGYLPLPRETWTAGPPPQLPCPSRSQLAALPKCKGHTGFLLSLCPCLITTGIWSHVPKFKMYNPIWSLQAPVLLPHSWKCLALPPKCMCFVLPECIEFSFSCLSSALIPLWPGFILLKLRKNLVPFPYFRKPQP